MTGWRRARLAWAACTLGLPNSSRQAATSALIGFHSASSRSQGGIPSVGTKLLEIMERLMARVDGLGLEVDGMLDLVNTVGAFVVGFVQAELAEAEAQRRTGLDEAQWREPMRPWMADVLATGRYPYLERIVIEAEDFPDPDVTFERRLALVLDGLATNLPHHEAHQGERTSEGGA